MKKTQSIAGIGIALIIGGLILIAGSHSSIEIAGLPLFVVCGLSVLDCTGLFFCPPSCLKQTTILT